MAAADQNAATGLAPDEVGFVSGRTRIFAILGHPIVQVRSPEMFTAEFIRRGHEAIMLPMHVLPEDFDEVLPRLMRIRNLGGLIFTIPFKGRAMAFAHEIGPQARVVGAVNAMAPAPDGRWKAEIFDGLGCVEGLRRRGFLFAGTSAMLIGAGGAGSAIAVAIAHEGPARLRLHDIDEGKVRALADKVRTIDPAIRVEVGPPEVEGMDILLNASPAGMLEDASLPIPQASLPPGLVVFDAIVKPERTRLLQLAQACGCTIVFGREMMRGQISRMTDFFGMPEAAARN
jgi:shikimate dehydrogenase